jgi:hypothetical protein
VTLPGLTHEQSVAKVAYQLERLKLFATSDAAVKAGAQQEIDDAVQTVTRLQEAYIDGLLGQGAYLTWKLLKEQRIKDPGIVDRLPPKDKTRWNQVDHVLEEGEI